MTRETPISEPPQFCSHDGMVLVDKSRPLDWGYDTFTGTKRSPVVHVTRECPTGGHDVWVLTDERWVKV